MLCSASAKDMKSDEWQTIFAHTFSQFLDWLPLDNNDQVFICWCDTVFKKLVLTTLEMNNDKQFQFAHTFSWDLDWLPEYIDINELSL